MLSASQTYPLTVLPDPLVSALLIGLKVGIGPEPRWQIRRSIR